MDTHFSVTLKETDLVSNKLILTTIDSAREVNEFVYTISLLDNGEIPFWTDGIKDQWVFSDRNCYYLTL